MKINFKTYFKLKEYILHNYLGPCETYNFTFVGFEYSSNKCNLAASSVFLEWFWHFFLYLTTSFLCTYHTFLNLRILFSFANVHEKLHNLETGKRISWKILKRARKQMSLFKSNAIYIPLRNENISPDQCTMMNFSRNSKNYLQRKRKYYPAAFKSSYFKTFCDIY